MCNVRRLLPLLLLMLFAPIAHAATEDDAGFDLAIDPIRSMTLTATSLTFNASVAEVLQGFTAAQQLSAEVSANTTWVVQVSGSSASWTGPWAKPLTDIQWSYSGSQFTSLSQTPATVVSGGPVNAQQHPLNFRVLLDISQDAPGTYTYEYVVVAITSQ